MNMLALLRLRLVMKVYDNPFFWCALGFSIVALIAAPLHWPATFAVIAVLTGFLVLAFGGRWWMMALGEFAIGGMIGFLAAKALFAIAIAVLLILLVCVLAEIAIQTLTAHKRYLVVMAPGENARIPDMTAGKIETLTPAEANIWFARGPWLLGPGVSPRTAVEVLEWFLPKFRNPLRGVEQVESFVIEPGDQILIANLTATPGYGFSLLECQER